MSDPRTHLFSNNAHSLLGDDLASGGTSLQLESGKGALFPNPGVDEIFILTIEDLVQGVREICYCSDRSGDVLTIERGKEGTDARNWTAGSTVIVQHRVTAGTLEYLAESDGAVVNYLDDILDVDAPYPVAGDVLTWDGYSWVSEAPADGAGNINLNSQAGASYTLAASDAGKCVEMSNGSANTVVVPPNADVPMDIGTTLLVRQMGAGVTTIQAGSGVTLRYPRGLSILYQYGSVSLHKRDTNEWCVEGSA